MAHSALTSPARPWVIRLLTWGTDALYILAILAVLDPILLLIMLAELLHTLTLTIQTHHLPLKPLLALVWIALIRHGVVLAALAASLATANAAATLAGIVILSAALAFLPAQDAD
jgi:uncharacterized membrane protein (DUF373 family)